MEKINIATVDTLFLPVVVESYPIWIKNEPHRSVSLEDEDDDAGRREYHVSQEPYRILLPPYEPAILVEDTRRQFFPFLAYMLDHPFNEPLISLSKVTGGIRAS